MKIMGRFEKPRAIILCSVLTVALRHIIWLELASGRIEALRD
jgi:hypothetical protein